MSFSVDEFRKNFPQLERKNGPLPLVYFDNGASTLKHSAATDRVNSYNRFETANVHRGAHQVSRQGTESYEGARSTLAQFIKAPQSESVIFTRGTTESINFVASTLESRLSPGDEVLISPFEHHSNIVPWQVACEKSGAKLVVAPFDKETGMTAEDFASAITEKTRLAAFLYHSNSFGHRLPVEKILATCQQAGIITVIDAAQTPLTERIDVSQLGCDFLCLSGHKSFGPYGIGILYIHEKWLDSLPPFQTGGSMIDRVSFAKTTYANAPQRFEAGTPNISGAIGLAAAINVLSEIDFAAQHQHVLFLRNKLKEFLESNAKLRVFDFPAEDYAGCLSFNVEGAHPSDVGTLFDKYGFAVRAGHHCTQPTMDLLGIPGTVRVSLAAYNSEDEVDRFIDTMAKVEGFFA